MSLLSRISLFKNSAEDHKDTATKLLAIQTSLSYLPHYSSEAHASSLIYPLCYTLKTLINAARIAQGSLLLLGALFEHPCQTLPKLIEGISLELGACILNAMNALVACLIFITRSLVSLNVGYPNKAAAEAARESFIGKVFFDIYNNAEEFLYEETTSLGH
ncbi:hypothetical protein [Legionella sp. km772]|uniref:hypothetical protein n=1 Tax=Legionella sp. km772 TaxID=2498111 RepID=UPI000F8CC23B|nr:hypothetical protein [Legionella sp. km772]RUR09727.1 hypothetical protein ELY15_08910 [Legionella sp. km772]